MPRETVDAQLNIPGDIQGWMPRLDRALSNLVSWEVSLLMAGGLELVDL